MGEEGSESITEVLKTWSFFQLDGRLLLESSVLSATPLTGHKTTMGSRTREEH